MSKYDINYKQIGSQLLPPDKRGKRILAYLAALLSPLQYLAELWLGDYRTGSKGLPWLSSTTYPIGERAVYKGSAYESILPGNINHLPTDPIYWRKVQKNFIGIEERLTYNGNVLIFTNAINKYFGTTFRQPNNVSDIYMVVHLKPITTFVVGYSETSSSKVFAATSSEFILDVYYFAPYFNLSIMVPSAVYNALDSDELNREKIIREFADRYIVAGITYKIETY